jgi:probable rRNA maturation factor
MIAVELDTRDWPDGDWQRLADRAVSAALAASPQAQLARSPVTIEISIRLTDDAEVRALNRQYRDKDKPTNVLSFAMVQPDLIAGLATPQVSADPASEILLGDIVLAHETCVREAAARGIPVADHATHLIVHGTLHLLGHDHMVDEDAAAMEEIEQLAMAALGLHDPYMPFGPIED